MSAIGVGGVIRYGFEMLLYHLLIYTIGGVIIGLGLLIVTNGADQMAASDPGSVLAGGLFGFFGGMVILAGELGIVYKIIADSVMAGMESSRGGSTNPRSSGGSSRATSGPRSRR